MPDHTRTSPTGLLEELYGDEYLSLHGDPHGPLLRFTRTAVPFRSIEDIERSYAALVNAVDRAGRRGRVMLADARSAPGRNDPAFEAVAGRMWPRIYQGLERVGVLVKTTVGKLHIERLAQEDGVARKVSTDEQTLLEYLLADLPSPASGSRGPRSRRGGAG